MMMMMNLFLYSATSKNALSALILHAIVSMLRKVCSNVCNDLTRVLSDRSGAHNIIGNVYVFIINGIDLGRITKIATMSAL